MTHKRPELWRRLLAEYVGTGFLVAVVVGSGISAQMLSPTDAGLQLFENAAATAAALVALILALGPVSGGHFNPVVSIADAVFGGLAARQVPGYVMAQVAGAVSGSIIANLMFGLPAVEWSDTARSGGGLWLAEVVATVGLLVVIFGAVRSGRTGAAPLAVGAYIGAAYFFTASTSFANPAVSVGRMFTDTFTGIAPSSVLAFLAFQLLGGALALVLVRALYPDVAALAADVAVPAPGHEPSPDEHSPPSVRAVGPDDAKAVQADRYPAGSHDQAVAGEGPTSLSSVTLCG